MADADRPYGYGFAIHGGAYGGRPCFRVLTHTGESLPLTTELVDRLRGRPCHVYGNRAVVAGLDVGPTSPASGPVCDLYVHLVVGRSPNVALRWHWSQLGLVRPRGMVFNPLVLCTASRPPGWPR